MSLTQPVGADDHRIGSLEAPVILVEYGDFECPYCGRAFPLVKQLVEQLGDQVCFVFRNFPLTEIHPHAELAAESAEAADALGGSDAFWAMHDTLFQNQQSLEGSDLTQYAADIGLDVKAFTEALTSRRFAEPVREDFLSGVRSGVNGTPTFFINGERWDGDWTNVQEFHDALTTAAATH